MSDRDTRLIIEDMDRVAGDFKDRLAADRSCDMAVGDRDREAPGAAGSPRVTTPSVGSRQPPTAATVSGQR